MNANGRIINRIFTKSVISIIVAAMAAMLGIVIDGIVIGRFLGPESMAAYGLVMPVANLVTLFSGVLSTGVQIVCAQRLGSGDIKGARKAFSMCMVITVIISVILISVILSFRNDIVVFLGAKGNSAYLLPYASEYLLGLAFSIPSMLFLFEFNTLLRLDGDPNRIILAVGVMTVLDIAGDIINALVIRGGMLGIGLATTISYAVAVVIVLFHFTKKDIIFRFSFKGLQLSDLKDIFLTGSSSAVGSASAVLRNTVLNNILVLTVLSGTAVGAFGIMNTVLSFSQCTMIGIGLTASMIAGMLYGDRDRTASEYLVRMTVKTDLLLGLSIGAVLFIFSGQIASIFGNKDGQKMVELAGRAIRFYAFSVALYGINNSFVNYVQGMKRMVIANIYGFLQNFLFIAVPAVSLIGLIDTDAVWAAFVIGEILTLICVVILAAVNKKGMPYRFRDFLFLPNCFDLSDEDICEISISRQEQVIPASLEIDRFCRKKGADAKIRLLLPLFVEELGNNVSSYGFGDDGKNSMDIRVICDREGFALRIRDNCRMFDPVEWARINETGDPAANIGIRMVLGMASDVSYVNTLELNILTIRI